MREFLKGLDLDKETIDTIMAEHGKLLTGLKEKTEALQGQIKERDNQIGELKKVDAAGLQAEIQRLQGENSKIIFDTALTNALTGAKAKSTKAVSAMLDVEKLKYENGKITGLDEQLEAVKKDHGYLFDVKSGGAGFQNKTPPEGEKTSNQKMNDLIRGTEGE